MLTVQPHSSQDYADLPNIDASDVGILSQEDLACLNELGDYLLRSKANERFGATLLHSHFPVRDDETLIEEVTSGAECITLRPSRSAASNLSAMNLCFEHGGVSAKEIRLIGLEFTSARSLCGVPPISDSDTDVLTGFGQILKRHGKSRRFGMRLLYDPLNLKGVSSSKLVITTDAY
jgi:hypothetical protein